MQLTVWIFICLVMAVALRKSVIGSVCWVLAVAILVPYIASPDLVGSYSDLHAATLAAFAVTTFQLLYNSQAARDVLSFMPGRFVAIVAVVIGCSAFSVRAGNRIGFYFGVDQVLAPTIIFLMVYIAHRVDGFRAVVKLRNFVIWIAAGEAAFSIIQWASRAVLLYEDQYRLYDWFDLQAFPRYMGTLDHPLALSMFLASAIPLLATWKRVLPILAVLSVLVIGIFVTESRVGVIAAGFGVAYVVVVSRVGRIAKLVIVSTVGAAVPLIASSGFVEGVNERFKNDSGSSDARGAARSYFIDHWNEYLLSGPGPGSSYSISARVGLATSLENPFFMYSIDIGLLLALMYFGLQAYLVVVPIIRSRCRIQADHAAGLLAVVIGQTYSSFATQSAASMVVWVFVGIASVTVSAERLEPVSEVLRS